eukprot:gene8303-9188_t
MAREINEIITPTWKRFAQLQHLPERRKDAHVPEEEDPGHQHSTNNDIWNKDLVTYQPPEREAGRYAKKHGKGNSECHKKR